MIINRDKRFVFVHIPKVAGTSISTALGSQPGMIRGTNADNEEQLIFTHTYASELRKFLGPHQYAAYFKFAFVRNPWDRLYSLYNFMVNSEEINRGGHIFDQDEAHRRGFKWFLLENRMKSTRVRLYGVDVNVCQQITPQMDWISENDKLIVDYVGTYENLQQDFAVISNQIGTTEPLPWKNKYTDKRYVDAYDNEMIEFVEKVHAKDIKMFNYTFDGQLTNRM
jgi:hypothetical protein